MTLRTAAITSRRSSGSDSRYSSTVAALLMTMTLLLRLENDDARIEVVFLVIEAGRGQQRLRVAVVQVDVAIAASRAGGAVRRERDQPAITRQRRLQFEVLRVHLGHG